MRHQSCALLEQLWQRQRDQFRWEVLCSDGDGDVLFAVDHVRHRISARVSRRLQLVHDRAGRLVVRVEHRAAPPAASEQSAALSCERRVFVTTMPPSSARPVFGMVTPLSAG